MLFLAQSITFNSNLRYLGLSYSHELPNLFELIVLCLSLLYFLFENVQKEFGLPEKQIYMLTEILTLILPCIPLAGSYVYIPEKCNFLMISKISGLLMSNIKKMYQVMPHICPKVI